jgi:hypothetical protein
MKLSCGTKQCNIGITKKHDGVSTKMLQAQMVKTKGANRVIYSNSKSDHINSIILSGDYAQNKKLLLCYKYNVYFRLLQPLSVNKPELIVMLNNIISTLTYEEKNSIYGIIPIVPVIVPPPVNIDDIPITKTYYVITRSMTETAKYFVFKNYSGDDAFVPTNSYEFNLEHPSNIGTQLSFAIDKNDNEYKYLTRSDISAGEVGAKLVLTLPQDISYNKLFLYNKNEYRVYKGVNEIDASYTEYDIGNLRLYRYDFWACMLSYIGIQLDSVSNKRLNTCKNMPPPQVVPMVPRNYDDNINKNTTLKYLTQSSILTGINYDGLHLYIQDIYDRTPVLYYTNFTFGLNIGTYYLFVPPIYTLAFLNKNQTDNFSYVGRNINTKVVDNVIGTGADTDGTYDFYSGTIIITITGSFQPISIYTRQFGYLDAKHIMVFSEKAPIVSGIPRIINI